MSRRRALGAALLAAALLVALWLLLPGGGRARDPAREGRRAARSGRTLGGGAGAVGAAPDPDAEEPGEAGEEPPRPFRGFEEAFDNGLTLVVVEDHQSPRAAVRIAVRAGSADDPRGLEGLAHLVEHLMFTGTRALGAPRGDQPGDAEAYARVVGLLGGKRLNAVTGRDRTVFQVTVPSNALAPLLRLEADRFAGILPWALDGERDVVRSEVRRRSDDAVAAAWEQLFAGHPGARPVGGTDESLGRVTPADVAAFVRDRYAPADLALVVVGDVDTAEVRELARDTLGALPAREPAPREDPRWEVRRPTARLPIGSPGNDGWAFPLAPVRPGDLEALELVAGLLDHRLRQVGPAVQNEWTQVVSTGDAALLVVGVHCRDRCGAPVEAALADVRTHTVSDRALARVRERVWQDHLRALESVEVQADRIAAGWAEGLDLDGLWGRLRRYRALDPARVREVAARALDPDAAVRHGQGRWAPPPHGLAREGRREVADDTPLGPFGDAVLAMPRPPLPASWRLEGRDWARADGDRVLAVRNPSNGLFEVTLRWPLGDRSAAGACPGLLQWWHVADRVEGSAWGDDLAALGVRLRVSCDLDRSELTLDGPGEAAGDALDRVRRALADPELGEGPPPDDPPLAERAWSALAAWGEDPAVRALLTRAPATREAAAAAVRRLATTGPEVDYAGPADAELVAAWTDWGEPAPAPRRRPWEPPPADVFWEVGRGSSEAVVPLRPYEPAEAGLLAAFEALWAGQAGLLRTELRARRGLYFVRARLRPGRFPGDPSALAVTHIGREPIDLAEAVRGALDEPAPPDRVDEALARAREEAWSGHVPFREVAELLRPAFAAGLRADPREASWAQLQEVTGEDLDLLAAEAAAAPLALRAAKPPGPGWDVRRP